jgi:hypothetical protein
MTKFFRFWLLLMGLAAGAKATTVIPPRFDELVADAELVFRGRVTETTGRPVELRTEAVRRGARGTTAS